MAGRHMRAKVLRQVRRRWLQRVYGKHSTMDWKPIISGPVGTIAIKGLDGSTMTIPAAPSGMYISPNTITPTFYGRQMRYNHLTGGWEDMTSPEEMSRIFDERAPVEARRIVRDAEEKANEILNRARREARECKEKAEKEAADYLLKVREQIKEVFTAIDPHLRGLLYEALTFALAQLRRGITERNEAAAEFRGFVEVLTSLNVFGEGQVDKVLTFLKEQLDEPCDERDEEEIMGMLAECGRAVRTTMLALPREEREEREEVLLLRSGR